MGRRPSRPIAVITGAGSGIGKATATRFVKEGFRVAALKPATRKNEETIAMTTKAAMIQMVTDEVEAEKKKEAAEAAKAQISCWFPTGYGADGNKWSIQNGHTVIANGDDAEMTIMADAAAGTPARL